MPIDNGLAAVRERLGWTQAKAGESAGITRQSYAAIESGASVPSTEVALRLARAMGRSVEELFRLPDAPADEIEAVWAGEGRPPGRRVRLVRIGGRTVAFPAGESERPSRAADGVVVGPAEPTNSGLERGGDSDSPRGEASESGHSIRVALLDERPREPDIAVIGCDPAFGIVAESLRRRRGMEVLWSARGSRAALVALADGRSHVAGVHLHDSRSGEFNGPWIREVVPFPCTRFRFATWEESLLVRDGNPEGIRGVADLARAGIRLVNREPGSGSRLLLDQALASEGVTASGIIGYDTAARGHLAVGEAIAAGLADVGVGIRAAGAAYGLDVIPLRMEPYELVVPDHFLDLTGVQALLDTLRLPGIRTQVEALQGYDGSGMGRTVGGTVEAG